MNICFCTFVLVEMMGFEPMTPCLQGRCSPNWATPPFDWVLLFLLCAFALVGPSGLEPPTSCLSGTRSNLLSYDPSWLVKWFFTWNGGDDGDSRAVRLRLLCSQLLFAIAPMRFRAVSEIGINFQWDLSRPFGTKFVPWWRWWDSNPWPPACRAGALPAELHPHKRCFSFFSTFF